MSKSFTVINKAFTCKHCGISNPIHSNSCRNHCTNCLYSLHVDELNPGDRASNCHSLMKPFKIEQSGKKGWMIYHKCLKCDKMIPNKSANDDNFDKLIRLSKPHSDSHNE